MNEKELLNKLINDLTLFLDKNYDLDLEIPVSLNGRLSTTLGRFRHSRTDGPIDIQIGKRFAMLNDYDEVLKVGYHECIHYARCVLGLPFKDGDAGFEADCARFGATSSGATDSRLRMTRTADVKGGRFVIYKCPDCGKEIEKSRRFNKRSVKVHIGCSTPLVEDRVEIRKG